VLACGAHLKNTFCLAQGERAWLGPHIGDLDNLEAGRAFEEQVERLQRFLGVVPEVIAHDLHPDYFSSAYARGRPETVKAGVQHHHAHVASAAAEHGVEGPLVGLAWDVGIVVLLPLFRLVPSWLGQPCPEPMMGWYNALQGPGLLTSALLAMASSSILFSMGALLLFVLARLLLRNDVLAMAVIAAVTVATNLLGVTDAAWVAATISVVWAVSWIALLLRFGLLAAIVGHFANMVFESLPLTTDLGSWTAGPTLAAAALVLVLAVGAFRSAAGGLGLRRALAGEAASRP